MGFSEFLESFDTAVSFLHAKEEKVARVISYPTEKNQKGSIVIYMAIGVQFLVDFVCRKYAAIDIVIKAYNNNIILTFKNINEDEDEDE